MKADRIKVVAIKKFVDHGFIGTSLADIGDDVGIKKQSIYSHFKNKDELFLTVYEEAIDHEISWMREYFEQRETVPLDEVLYEFLKQLKERYLNDDHLGLLLRMAFYPPSHLHDPVMGSFSTYLGALEELLLREFTSTRIELAVKPEEAMIAYMNLLDGLIVELIYQGIEKFYTRLDISWQNYWRGITR